MAELEQHTLNWLRNNLKPLRHDTNFDAISWINNIKHPEWRKRELRNIYFSMPHINQIKSVRGIKKYVHTLCKSFVKFESYDSYKHARSINARVDEFKVFFGPYVTPIESVLYEHPAFIKHVPVEKRAQYVDELLSSFRSTYGATDHTSFESMFTKNFMDKIEMHLFEYMLQNVPNNNFIIRMIREALTGKNHLQYKWFTVELEATRMSGDMCTSLCNGFSNLMIITYLIGNCPVVVEGDDSLYRSNNIPDPRAFAELGANAKIEIDDEVCLASFCGLVYNQYNFDSLTDPVRALLKLGWSTRNYVGAKNQTLEAMLRVKALSYICQFPNCPIISKFCKIILDTVQAKKCKMLRYIFGRNVCDYNRHHLLRALDHKYSDPIIHIESRRVIAIKYGIDVASQLKIESDMDFGVFPFKSLTLLDFVSRASIHNYDNFVNNFKNNYEPYPLVNLREKFENLRKFIKTAGGENREN